MAAVSGSNYLDLREWITIIQGLRQSASKIPKELVRIIFKYHDTDRKHLLAKGIYSIPKALFSALNTFDLIALNALPQPRTLELEPDDREYGITFFAKMKKENPAYFDLLETLRVDENMIRRLFPYNPPADPNVFPKLLTKRQAPNLKTLNIYRLDSPASDLPYFAIPKSVGCINFFHYAGVNLDQWKLLMCARSKLKITVSPE